MSLQSRLADFISTVGADIKALTTLASAVNVPAYRTTTPGASLDVTSALLGSVRTSVLNSNLAVTINATSPPSNVAGTVTLIFRQPSSGSLYSVTWPSGLEWVEDSSAPAVPQVFNGILLVDLMWTGDVWLAMPGRFQL